MRSTLPPAVNAQVPPARYHQCEHGRNNLESGRAHCRVMRAQIRPFRCPLLHDLDGDWWAEAMLDQMDGRESPWRTVSGSAAATHQSTLTGVVIRQYPKSSPSKGRAARAGD